VDNFVGKDINWPTLIFKAGGLTYWNYKKMKYKTINKQQLTIFLETQAAAFIFS